MKSEDSGTLDQFWEAASGLDDCLSSGTRLSVPQISISSVLESS